MAIDFPASPTNGQTFTSGSVTYTWDGTKWTAVAAGGGATDKITEGNTSAEVIDTGSDGRFVVTTEGSERLRVDSSGRLGIGTSTPDAKLHLSGGAEDVALRISSSNGSAIFGVRNSAYGALGVGDTYIYNNGDNITLMAEDSSAVIKFASGGSSERCRLDASGRLLVGTSTSNSNTNSKFQIADTSSNVTTTSYSANNSSAGYYYFFKNRGASVDSHAVLQSGDGIANLWFGGSDGTTYRGAASIEAVADGGWSSGDAPGRLVFSTTADGASSPSTRMTLFSNGNIRAVETASAYFYPGIDNSIYLGSPSFRYNLVYSVNGTASSSDEREKTEINDAALGIDFIKSLRPVSYKWKVGHNDVEAGDEGDVVIPRPGLRTHWGFLAQDVKQAADQAGVDFGGWILTDVDDPESPQGLRYQQFIAPLTKALQEAIAKIETLEAKVAALESA